jgi:hypothetical protein
MSLAPNWSSTAGSRFAEPLRGGGPGEGAADNADARPLNPNAFASILSPPDVRARGRNP